MWAAEDSIVELRISEATERVGPELEPEFSGDFPEVLAALARRAEG